MGRYTMNLPMIPGQKSNGKNGARVVMVPARTGINISPAAIFVARFTPIFPLPSVKILCAFSITTMASSTMIPSPKSNAKSTMKFKVTCVPIIKSAPGNNTNATNMLRGTLKATKNALVNPMKNISTSNTKINPMMIEFTSSLKEAFVLIL